MLDVLPGLLNIGLSCRVARWFVIADTTDQHYYGIQQWREGFDLSKNAIEYMCPNAQYNLCRKLTSNEQRGMADLGGS